MGSAPLLAINGQNHRQYAKIQRCKSFNLSQPSLMYVCGMAAVKRGLFMSCVCVSQHAEVSCFDDVALLYHPLKQCNSIVIAFGLRPTLQQQQACSRRMDAAERSETDEKIGSMEKPLQVLSGRQPHPFPQSHTHTHTYVHSASHMTQTTGWEQIADISARAAKYKFTDCTEIKILKCSSYSVTTSQP